MAKGKEREGDTGINPVREARRRTRETSLGRGIREVRKGARCEGNAWKQCVGKTTLSERGRRAEEIWAGSRERGDRVNNTCVHMKREDKRGKQTKKICRMGKKTH